MEEEKIASYEDRIKSLEEQLENLQGNFTTQIEEKGGKIKEIESLLEDIIHKINKLV